MKLKVERLETLNAMLKFKLSTSLGKNLQHPAINTDVSQSRYRNFWSAKFLEKVYF